MVVNSASTKHYGIYRGIVVDNRDDGTLPDGKKIDSFGRCKVFFDGIYPEKFRKEPQNLPWAEPVFPIFGGSGLTSVQDQKNKEENESPVYQSFSNDIVGFMSTPHVGAVVWGFFEDGNIQYPKFFGTTHTGMVWQPEHRNQHVIATDNVQIIIDEEPENELSTARTDSANTLSTSSCEAFKEVLKKKNLPVRLNITINAVPPENSLMDPKDNKSYCAVNLTINGNVNRRIYGNVYEYHEGDLFTTHIGNTYKKETGDVEIEHVGTTIERHKDGDQKLEVINANNYETYHKNQTMVVVENLSDTVKGNQTLSIDGTSTNTIQKDRTTTVNGSESLTVSKSMTTSVSASLDESAGGAATYKSANTTIDGGASITAKGGTINLN